MNPAPTFFFWRELFGSVALEMTLIFLLALALQRFVRSGVWQRTIWQTALLGFGLVALLELTGFSRAAPACWTNRPPISARTPALANTPRSPLPVIESAV